MHIHTHTSADLMEIRTFSVTSKNHLHTLVKGPEAAKTEEGGDRNIVDEMPCTVLTLGANASVGENCVGLKRNQVIQCFTMLAQMLFTEGLPGSAD